MKVGILTYHRSLNYGAFLQAVCLCSRLNLEKDISAEIIDYDMRSAQIAYRQFARRSVKKRIRQFVFSLMKKGSVVWLDSSKAFQRGYEKAKDLLSKDSVISDDIEDFRALVKGNYDVIISGSDEIWQIKPMRGFPNPYFLPGDFECRKFSYAASARMDFDTLPEDRHRKLKEYLHDYEFISVRDRKTYDSILKEGTPKEKLMLSCDPSFLYDFPEDSTTVRELLRGKCTLNPKKKLLVLTEIHPGTAENIVSQVKDEYNVISIGTKNAKCINLADVDPFEWRLLLSKADMVVTSLFHGTCFSITGNTPFITVVREDKESKLEELLYKTEFAGHCVEEKDVPTIDWKKKFACVSEAADYRDFVLRQRKNFDVFLQKLRGEK